MYTDIEARDADEKHENESRDPHRGFYRRILGVRRYRPCDDEVERE